MRQFNDWELEEMDAFFERLGRFSIHLSKEDSVVWLGTKD